MYVYFVFLVGNCYCRCDVFDMHNELVPYAKAWSWQKSNVEERKKLIDKNEDFCDSVIILQHPSVYTLGTGSSEDHLKGIKNFYRTDRGGEVTYHGPGQVLFEFCYANWIVVQLFLSKVWIF